MIRPTDEQAIAVEKFKSGRPLKISAFAGTGKTSTLTLMARAKNGTGLYLAFNKAIATEATEKFPRSVDCRTTHSLAYRAVQPGFRSNDKLSKTLHPKQLAAAVGYKLRRFGEGLQLTEVQQAHLLLSTIKQFCQSDAPALGDAHVPRYGRLLGVEKEVLAQVRAWASREAALLWTRMTNRDDELPLGHDGYLKLWALGAPKFGADYILLDEAQDTNGVVLGVLRDQRSQIVYVGDRHQQIYEWRGAINAMEQVQGCDEAFLTQSFRFGARIASEASRVLATLGETHALRGNPAVNSDIVAADDAADAVLARTNATVIVEVLEATRLGRRPFIVGGTADLKRLLSDVYELKKGNPASSPEFFGYANWSDVVAAAADEEGEAIRMFVQLVEQHGESKLWSAVKSVVDDEKSADIILSTAHKAKGREWDTVRLANDFASSRSEASTKDREAEVRLFYVAMTRARKRLAVDPAMLAIFTSGEWKTRKPAAPRAAPAATAPTYRQPASRSAASPRQSPRPPPSRAAATPRTDAPSKRPPPRPATKPSLWERLFGK